MPAVRHGCIQGNSLPDRSAANTSSVTTLAIENVDLIGVFMYISLIAQQDCWMTAAGDV
jgi:hypothetical protein